MYLQTHQKEVADMVAITKDLEATSRQLQEHLKFNHSSLKNAIEYLMLKVEQAQENLKREGRTIVTKVGVHQLPTLWSFLFVEKKVVLDFQIWILASERIW